MLSKNGNKKIPLNTDDGKTAHRCIGSNLKCRGCGHLIKFDDSKRSKRSKLMPLDLDRRVHIYL